MRLNFKIPAIKITQARFAWTAEHAEEVHNGAVFIGGARGVDRPFTEVAIDQTDLPELVKEHYRDDVSAAFEAAAVELGNIFTDVIENHVWDIPPGGQKQHKNAPTWKTIDDSGELKESQTLEFE